MKKRTAFTLMETLITVTILGILASVILPAMQSTNTRTLESAARILAADLRLARSLAIQFNTDYTVRFDQQNNVYEIVHTGTGNPPPITNPLAPNPQDGTYLVELERLGATSSHGNGVSLVAVMLDDSRQPETNVTFGPLGGTGPARSEDTVIWLAKGRPQDVRFVRLTVSWVTGQVWIDESPAESPATEN